jgi:hypothetical protein
MNSKNKFTNNTQSVNKSLNQAIQKEREDNLEIATDFAHEFRKPLSIIRTLLSSRRAKISTELAKEVDLEIVHASKVLDEMVKVFDKR